MFDSSGNPDVMLATGGHGCRLCGRLPVPDVPPEEQITWAEGVAAVHRDRKAAVRNHRGETLQQ